MKRVENNCKSQLDEELLSSLRRMVMDGKPYLEHDSTRDAEVLYNKKIGRKRTYKENDLATRTPMRIKIVLKCIKTFQLPDNQNYYFIHIQCLLSYFAKRVVATDCSKMCSYCSASSTLIQGHLSKPCTESTGQDGCLSINNLGQETGLL